MTDATLSATGVLIGRSRLPMLVQPTTGVFGSGGKLVRQKMLPARKLGPSGSP